MKNADKMYIAYSADYRKAATEFEENGRTLGQNAISAAFVCA
jgi:hypothetical protein